MLFYWHLFLDKLSFFSANLVWVRQGSGATFGVEKGGKGEKEVETIISLANHEIS